jgi:hypothetical protein
VFRVATGLIPRARAWRRAQIKKFAQSAGTNDFSGLRGADYTCEMIPGFDPERTRSPAALALLDQRQDRSNRILEVRDPADDGG